ncbi:MAG: hypothetical protein JRJ85_27350 [Deltaproteobacteria bacterium]|nr:hypothetical protein [Deltaproteobacteria bacterium]
MVINTAKDRRRALAKITRPNLPDVFPRKRLFDRLDHLRSRPAVWISGPAGCGKTTLVASYLEARGLPCIWYQLDQADVDPAAFFYYMGLAAKKAAPRRKKFLHLLTPDVLPGLDIFALHYFENLYGRLKTDSALVLDNYQEVPDESLFHNVIRRGLEAVPDGITVILVSRMPQPAPLTRMLAGRTMGSLGWEDIRLSPDEAEGIACLHFENKVPGDLISRLHTTTDGWAAGLVLMAEFAKRISPDPSAFDGGTPEEVFDFFASEVFENADPAIQEFLLTTAVLPGMTSRMARELTGSHRADEILSGLNRNHLFTDKRLSVEDAYQYHPLFRDFLLTRAKKTYSGQKMAGLKKKAAGLLEEEMRIEDAFALFRQAGNTQGMIRLILEHAQGLLRQGRHQTLAQWLGSLPGGAVGNNPWLLYWAGACRMPVNPVESRDLFEKALTWFEKQQDSTGMLLSFCGVFDAIAYGLRVFHPFDKWIPRLDRFFRGLQSPPPPPPWPCVSRNTRISRPGKKGPWGFLKGRPIWMRP